MSVLTQITLNAMVLVMDLIAVYVQLLAWTPLSIGLALGLAFTGGILLFWTWQLAVVSYKNKR